YALRTSEPGSTIKLIPLLTALDEQNKTIQDNIDIHGGKWNIKGRVVSDDHGGAASITLKQAFALSSNVAMSKLAYEYYNTQPEKYYAKLKSLNLTSKTGIELKEEFTPVVPNPKNKKNWNDQTLVSWGFGYALLVSPLQLLMVYNAVANNGRLMKPYLINEIRSYGTVIQKNNPVVLNSAIASANTISQLRECMEAVCTEGTARGAFQNSLYKVAGKTGTAKVNDGKYKYKDGVYQSSFAGYFPANNPKYSIIVTIKNKPGAAGYYASTVAAPVFKEIADHLFKYIEKPVLPQQLTAHKDSFGYQFSGSRESVRLLANQFGWQGFGKSTGNWQQIVLSKQNISEKEISVVSGLVPNVIGMGLKDALFLLESAGY
ncbi:MAG: penicillin-binding transpeptidase domain-containing protein, partial [Bacteroidota bacterium]